MTKKFHRIGSIMGSGELTDPHPKEDRKGRYDERTAIRWSCQAFSPAGANRHDGSNTGRHCISSGAACSY